VSAGALWLVFKLTDGLATVGTITSQSTYWLFGAVVSLMFIVFLLSWRWLLLCQNLSVYPSTLGYFALFRLTWASLGVSQIALGPVSADALRIAGLHQHGMAVSESLRVVLLDRIIGLMGLLLLTVGAVFVSVSVSYHLYFILSIVFAVAVYLVCVKIACRLSQVLKKVLANFHAVVATLSGQFLLMLSVLAHFANIAAYICIAKALDLAPPLPETIVSVAAGLLGAMVPVSLGGWGIRELAIFHSFQIQNADFDGAVSVSLIFGLLHVAMGIPGLLLFALFQPMHAGLEQEPERNA